VDNSHTCPTPTASICALTVLSCNLNGRPTPQGRVRGQRCGDTASFWSRHRSQQEWLPTRLTA